MDKILLFDLNNNTFGIELKYVKEVLEGGEVKPVPLTPSFISGLLNRRGKFLTIINVAELLGVSLKRDSQDFRIIVLDNRDMDIGILVNKIVGAKTVSIGGNGNKGTLETIGGGEKTEFYQMVLKNVGNIPKVTILNLESVFNFFWEYKF
ncbi:MAG: chemotaxis protein CheW [Pseudomonadota bacterium]